MEKQLSRIYRVTAHTAHVGLGSTFVAIPGTRHNGNDFVPRAIAAGAGRIVVQNESFNAGYAVAAAHRARIPVDYVSSARCALASYSMHAYGTPHKDMHIVGITGTKGKTTTALLTAHLLRYSNISTACITSTGAYINGTRYQTTLTTPQPDMLHMFFAHCRMHGVQVVVMEVAAQALTLDRVAGISFDTIVLTNISHEHGEFYTTHADYVAAKAAMLDYAVNTTRIYMNADDRTIAQMRPVCGSVCWYGYTAHASYSARIVSPDDVPVEIAHPDWPETVMSTLYGSANAYNVLVATLIARDMGASWPCIRSAHRYFPGAPGRMEEIRLQSGATVCLDYAHNVASYHAVLSALRARFNCVWVVFGASGERDRSKRAPMARVACMYADYVIITTDNPRSESVETIMADLHAGMPDSAHVYEIRDRRRAITWACRNASSDAVIAVLGKGRDAYQMIDGIAYPHSDFDVINQFV